MLQKGKTSPSATQKGREKALFFLSALESFLERLPQRSRDIVEVRFGARGDKTKTLEEIGRSYNITRERVRQVIGNAIKLLSREKGSPLFVEVAARIQSTLEGKNGIMQAEEFLKKLAPTGGKERGAILVFIKCLPTIIREEKETQEHDQIYTLKNFSLTEWGKIQKSVKEIFLEAGQTLNEKDLFVRFAKKNNTISKQKLFDFLSVAKSIRRNVFGKWGLADWSDVRPRGTREKVHLILKMFGKPLHFRKTAAMIDKYGLQGGRKSQSHPQTVHNELIKDKRFVLVGRGVYALSEWGYKKGTVKEVLESIFAQTKKPLSRDEVLTEVLKVRRVKRSTVIINLNTFFERVGKDTYR